MSNQRPSQKQRVLDAMKSHGSISPWYAINTLGNTILSATIHSIKRDIAVGKIKGVKINTEIVQGVNKFGDKIRYAKYLWVQE